MQFVVTCELHVYVYKYTYIYIYIHKGKGKVHPRTGHEGPEME